MCMASTLTKDHTGESKRRTQYVPGKAELFDLMLDAAYAGMPRATQDDSGMDDEQWWAANASLLAQILDNHAYPTVSRVGSAAGAAQRGAYNAGQAFEFGWLPYSTDSVP